MPRNKIMLKVVSEPSCWNATGEKLTSVTITYQDPTIVRGSGKLFKATNGIEFRSCECPEWSPSINVLYIHGNNTYRDDRNLDITPADFARVVEAVREWNAIPDTTATGGADGRLSEFAAELRAIADRYSK